MNRRSPETIRKRPRVPAYIVTFSDMVTLLLTFFVMLLSLAQVQDPELFNIGRDSFFESISNFGLGLLYGKQKMPDLGDVKIKYFIGNPEEALKRRIIDARQEQIYKALQKVKWSIQAMPSQMIAKRVNFSVVDIRFSRGSATLSQQAKKRLTQFILDLQDIRDAKRIITLYVIGLAADGITEKQRWILSAKRAAAVANFLRDAWSWPSECSICWWGARAGDEWTERNNFLPEQSQILIAVLRTDN